MNIEQERADFEAWCETRHLETGRDDKGDYILLETDLSWEAYQAGRAALQSQKPEPNDLMLSGVLRMPFEMSMATEISRVQFYHRAQQALNELEALQSQDRDDAERYRFLRSAVKETGRVVEDMYELALDGEDLDTAIDHARRIEGEGE